MKLTINHEDFKGKTFEELCLIPIDELKKKDFDLYVQLYCTMYDSSSIIESECPYIDSEEKIIFESFLFEDCKKIIIYLIKNNNKLSEIGKTKAPLMLEQIFDHEDNLISESIKENPHYISN